ncbi:MAG: histidine triad nucleotide-binding protein [Alphaproteobacteria bacterium]|nr:histidine triad nucleotide-binding protein [Alphaproteobacteria bacterium]
MNTYDDDNIFAKILRNELPNDTVYESEYVLAFKDINPQAPVHILVIPKGRYISIDDFGSNATAEEIKGFYEAVSKIVEQENIKQDGYRTITNTGINGGQEVPHFHLHILGGTKIGVMVSKAV